MSTIVSGEGVTCLARHSTDIAVLITLLEII